MATKSNSSGPGAFTKTGQPQRETEPLPPEDEDNDLDAGSESGYGGRRGVSLPTQPHSRLYNLQVSPGQTTILAFSFYFLLYDTYSYLPETPRSQNNLLAGYSNNDETALCTTRILLEPPTS